MKRKPEVLLEEWRFAGRDNTKLRGYMYHHRVIPDGYLCRTSQIVFIDIAAGICETQNSFYTLGRRLQ